MANKLREHETKPSFLDLNIKVIGSTYQRGLSSKSILAWWHVDKFDCAWCTMRFYINNIRLENDKVRNAMRWYIM